MVKFASASRRHVVAALSLLAAFIPRRGGTQQRITHVVYFDSGDHDLSLAGLDQVRAAARLAWINPQARVICIGHTDRVGSVESNNILSIRRANTVKLALMGEGIAEESILVIGKGWSEPVAPLRGWLERARDRRVEIVMRLDERIATRDVG